MSEEITPRQPGRDDQIEQILRLMQEIMTRLDAIEAQNIATRPMRERIDQLFAEVVATREEMRELGAKLDEFKQETAQSFAEVKRDIQHYAREMQRRQTFDEQQRLDLEERIERLEGRMDRIERHGN